MEDATSADYGPIAPIAAIHEFGAPEAGIPPRSFMRSTSEAKKQEWANQAAGYLKGAIDKQGIEQAFTGIGQKMAADIQEKIQWGIDPALKPATIAQKTKLEVYEPDLPLVRKGSLLASIDLQFVDDIEKV